MYIGEKGAASLVLNLRTRWRQWLTSRLDLFTPCKTALISIGYESAWDQEHVSTFWKREIFRASSESRKIPSHPCDVLVQWRRVVLNPCLWLQCYTFISGPRNQPSWQLLCILGSCRSVASSSWDAARRREYLLKKRTQNKGSSRNPPLFIKDIKFHYRDSKSPAPVPILFHKGKGEFH